MRSFDDDLDETARLILMESPGCSLTTFTAALREHFGSTLGIVEIGNLWRMYRGFDGRGAPTHDVVTGERIRGLLR